jgi:hypothetical protein
MSVEVHRNRPSEKDAWHLTHSFAWKGIRGKRGQLLAKALKHEFARGAGPRSYPVVILEKSLAQELALAFLVLPEVPEKVVRVN